MRQEKIAGKYLRKFKKVQKNGICGEKELLYKTVANVIVNGKTIMRRKYNG